VTDVSTPSSPVERVLRGRLRMGGLSVNGYAYVVPGLGAWPDE
jgi:hypothetical protein